MDAPNGNFVWIDLTVPDADSIRDFYCKVAGWTWEALSLGEYNDYMIKNANGEPVAGICHQRGVNQNVPPYWLNYLKVESVNNSLDQCINSGGKLIDGPRKMGENTFIIIQAPAGAYVGLFGKE